MARRPEQILAMNSELAAYAASIERRLTQICDCADGLSAEELNWRAPLGDANSAWVLATHTLGNARAWVLGIACGQPLGRDRPGEFASTGDDAARLRADVASFVREMTAAIERLSPADLDRRLLPAKELWGAGESHEISVRDALVHVIEHASLHLGHVQITLDLLRSG
jgi:uncharacterized damage-inducible protein DinB